MAITIGSSFSASTSFSLTDINNGASITLSDSASSSSSYTYGSGTNQIKNAVSLTGQLSSGGFVSIDLYSLSQTTFGSTQSIQFTGIKHFNVFNTSTNAGYDFLVRATGTNACTNLFNGGTGNLIVKPYSSFCYNDPYSGFVVSTGQRYIHLNDGGSGVAYKLIVLGLN